VSQAACINDEIVSRFAWTGLVDVQDDVHGDAIAGVVIERLYSGSDDTDVSLRLSLRDAETLCAWLKEQPSDLSVDAFLARAQGQV